MARLQPQTGWSYQGMAPRRVKSMTYSVRPGTEPSAIRATAVQYGIRPIGSWFRQSERLVVPVPSFPV